MKKILILSMMFLSISFLQNNNLNVEKARYELTDSSIIDVIRNRNINEGSGYFVINGEYIYINITSIQTPNGTSIEVYDILNDMSQSLISTYNSTFDYYFPNATRLYSASARFNCHSYAWNNQSYSNTIWMNCPDDYFIDQSYEEVSTPRMGDIICYFYNNGTPYDFTDDLNIHSGIVVNYNGDIIPNYVCGNSNQVIVKSKWGPAGVYQHSGDYCPYVGQYGGDANYVKYFRPRTNETLNFTNPTANLPQIVERYYDVSINSDYTNNYAMYEITTDIFKSYNFEISSSNMLNIRLYDRGMNLLNINLSINTSNNNYTYTFSKYINPDIYYLRISYLDSSNYGVFYTKIINNHSHNHNYLYQWDSLTGHKAYCLCSDCVIEAHVVSPNAFNNGQQYATCLLCNGLASFGGIIHQGIGNYPHTSNGSYILPNGVIVLVDDDIDAYLSGTLVFIYPNEYLYESSSISFRIIRKEEDYILRGGD